MEFRAGLPESSTQRPIVDPFQLGGIFVWLFAQSRVSHFGGGAGAGSDLCAVDDPFVL